MSSGVHYGVTFDSLDRSITEPVKELVNSLLDVGSYKSTYVEWERRPYVCQALINEIKHVGATRGANATLDDVLEWLSKASKLRIDNNDKDVADAINSLKIEYNKSNHKETLTPFAA
jgi:hypothetical protein